MKIISKKEFLPTVCVIYTILSLGKIILEAGFQRNLSVYQQNFIVMFFLSFIATLILSQHYRLSKLPLPLVALIQYAILIGIVMLVIWSLALIEPIHPNGYRDMFWSFTIPYIIGAALYYAVLYVEIRKADHILQDIKNKKQAEVTEKNERQCHNKKED